MAENKTGLEIFNSYKNKVLETLLLEDNELVRAIANSNTEFMDNEVVDPTSLSFTQVFPFKWMGADVLEKKETYVTMSFGVEGLSGRQFNSITFTIYIIVHKDIMRIFHEDQYKLRTDFISERIEELLNNSPDYGLGRLALTDAGEVFVSKLYPAVFLTFRTIDQGKGVK